MATHTRSRSGTVSGPHSLSLKVLRLSRPSLATHTPLPHTSPFSNGLNIPPTASLAHPSGDSSSGFPLTPLLTLPSAFGAAYVGETFTCTLCVNNEIVESEEQRRKGISGVRVQADLQTPTTQGGVRLELDGGEDDDDADDNGEKEFKAGETLQRTIRHELKEEGAHVLIVTVTYTETLRTASGDAATTGRVRTFRKLYQFVAQQLLAVRSKVTDRVTKGNRQWILEAQLENVGEASVALEQVKVKESEGITSKDCGVSNEKTEMTVLKPQDIEQVMFLLEADEKQMPNDINGRVRLAQLNIDWRSAMGERGSLTTGWLASRGR